MKRFILFTFLFTALAMGSSYSQITNLKVMGSTSAFSVNSGDMFGWSYNVPTAGDTTLIQMWIDTDANGVLNPAVDVLWTFFNQIDGDPKGQGGPPDDDKTANKFVGFQMPLGLAPAHYIILFRNHGHYTTATGVVNHMTSPVFTISGTVTVPTGVSKKNIVLSMESDNSSGSGMFWNAVSDANGNYTIEMNADTAGSPWYIRLNNPFVLGSAVADSLFREVRFIHGTTAYTHKDFNFTAASGAVSGKILFDDGTPVMSGEVFVFSGAAAGAANGTFHFGMTDTAGVYNIGFLASELPAQNLMLDVNMHDEENYIMPSNLFVPPVYPGETVPYNFTIFKANSTITGKVLVDGLAPGFGVDIYCAGSDSVLTKTFTDPEGNFSIPVTNKVYNYTVGASTEFMDPSKHYTSTPVTAHPGNTGLVLNISSTTGVKKNGGNVPTEFSLEQNYPNPFNPTTTISYSTAKEGFVSLTVYNLLGSKVATLVSESKPAGQYSVQFDGSSLSSGIYLYRLEAGNYVSIKKLVLMK